MRLIDVDKFKEEWNMADFCEDCKRDERTCDRQEYSMMDFCGWLDNAPTEQQWIPVSERLPEEDGMYEVTIIIDGDRSVDIDFFCLGYLWDDFGDKVIAWRECPEPYKE